MYQYECSVIVVQYNPIWKKMESTLRSIINQKGCSFEIVIADDGSKNPLFEKTIKFFKTNQFFNYKIVANEINGGTVKNVISGLKNASGKYSRVIAPGDLLYDNKTLIKIITFMRETNVKIAFGKLACYENEENNIQIHPKKIPFCPQVYLTYNQEKIKNHLIGLSDNISGASYTWEREYYLKCLLKICDKVKFLEDCVSAIAVYDNNRIGYQDEYVVWYELGTGISTSSSEKWKSILAQDWVNFFEVMKKDYSYDLRVLRTSFFYKLVQKNNIVVKILRNIMFLDWRIFRMISNKKKFANLPNIDELLINMDDESVVK